MKIVISQSEHQNINMLTCNISDMLLKANSRAAKGLWKKVSKSFPLLEYAVYNIFSHANAAQGCDIRRESF
jgi:hypothetical protein